MGANRLSAAPRGVLAAAALTLSLGCATSPNYLTGYSGPPGGAPSAFVDITNPRLERRVQLLETRMHDRNGILNAAAILKNNTRSTVQFEYLFQFYDAHGFEIRDTKAHWIPERILGFEEKQIAAVAPNSEATTFKVVIRAPEPITR